MDREEIIRTLNDLIQITEDSHEGYRHAAETVDNPALKALFNDLSAQRGAIVRDLQRHVAEQGGTPEASGTILGGAHRFFAGLKSAVMGQDREIILREVERGETEAISAYEAALQQELPPYLAQNVGDHLARLREGLRRVTVFNDASAGSGA